MAAKRYHHLLLLFLFTTSFLLSLSHSLNSDGLSLLALKSAITSDPTRSLSTWSDSDPTPCRWIGVNCSSSSDHVTSISLSGLRLSGYIPSELGALLFLRRLTLSNNNFSGPIPPRLFHNASSLSVLDLSHNALSGPLPPQISSLKTSLASLDLSSNLLTGPVPARLADLTRLTAGTLNLSYNRFTGEIPPSFGRFPVMVSLDLRYNNLSGKIPQVGSLFNQGPTAFAGNPGLCGFPLDNACPEKHNGDGPLNPGEFPVGSDPNLPREGRTGEKAEGEEKGKLLKPISVPFISGAFVVVGAVILSVLIARRNRRLASMEAKKTSSSSSYGEKKKKKKDVVLGEKEQVEVVVVSNGGAESSEGEKEGRFVVMDEGFHLDLEDLLRASAYVVGKSRTGIVYKVVTGSGVGGGSGKYGAAAGGSVVAVRRLSETDDAATMMTTSSWRVKEFESEVEAIARIQHPNIVRLRAYYYATNEKLLVSDFIGNGSLYTALHGTPANESPPLSWASRLKIAQGAARGLAHIHESTPRKHVHGNIKSSKILLDDDLNPYISGFGLRRLVSSPSHTLPPVISTTTTRRHSHHHHNHNHGISNRSNSIRASSELLISSSSIPYSAPEARSGGHKLTQRCDVYSFGVVLLEMLTGQLPSGPPGAEVKKGLEDLVREVFLEERPLSEIIDAALLHEVHAKKQVLAVFHVALSCTERDPDLRPRMKAVLESLEGIVK